MFDDKYWNEFWNSGFVQDYLNYKKNEKAEQNDNFNQGISNQGTNNRGE